MTLSDVVAAATQGLANICWAYAKLGWVDAELLDGVALALQGFASTMCPRDITEILWSYSAHPALSPPNPAATAQYVWLL